MAGQPYVIRLVSGLRAPKNPVPGLDVAGTVVAASADVTGFAVGEEVLTALAGLAEQCLRGVLVRPHLKLAPLAGAEHPQRPPEHDGTHPHHPLVALPPFVPRSGAERT